VSEVSDFRVCRILKPHLALHVRPVPKAGLSKHERLRKLMGGALTYGSYCRTGSGPVVDPKPRIVV